MSILEVVIEGEGWKNRNSRTNHYPALTRLCYNQSEPRNTNHEPERANDSDRSLRPPSGVNGSPPKESMTDDRLRNLRHPPPHTTRKILAQPSLSSDFNLVHTLPILLSSHHVNSPASPFQPPLTMSPVSVFRVATRAVRPASLFRAPQLPRARLQTPVALAINRPAFSTSSKRLGGHHEDETYEEFSARFEKEFDGVQDVFELQRNLNNCFAYDLVPSVEVLSAALRAARRVNDFPTAVRVFEGIKAKVETQDQYKQYLEALEGLRQELGVALREELYPGEQ
ncbi:cytochrome c oxidase subunit VA-domain-containing protein [Aspergillus novoparasiticus]|nr:cytochrome c oxidase subunit VA-domain-containing protein [Aspergillus novoparasiticus]